MAISLFNIGLNLYGQLKRNKKVSIWTQTNPAREVLVGSIVNNTKKSGQSVAETLSHGSVIMSCKASAPSKLCEHPIENGGVITDHKVILPKQCTITIAMPAYYQDIVIKEIEKYHKESTPLCVHDCGMLYENMVITDYPHTTDVKTANRLVFTIEMKEIIVVDPKYVKLDISKVKAAKDASTVKKGIKNTKEKVSILADIRDSNAWKKAKEFIGGWWENL
ncbi:MAG: hypothetical protein IKP96_00830 [Elusimicrobiaceae bacterium]|nr:hypothetical protein [Elusimicrobiaceae bacterium]